MAGNNLKPIETEYHGYKFRSRLEARWAVFFDAAGIKYSYEPEGYETESGNKYLPDFFLPEFDLFVEVKPDVPERVEKDIRKCEDVIQWGGDIKGILILSDIPPACEDPGLWHFPLLYYHSMDGVMEGWWVFFVDNGGRVLGTVSRAGLGLSVHRMSGLSVSAQTDYSLSKNLPGNEWPYWMTRKLQHDSNGRLFNALDKARQARFEHGACG